MEQDPFFVFRKVLLDGYRYFFKINDEDFECTGDEVLVESSPPASPSQMAARLATPAQSATTRAASPGGTHRELIVIPELPNSIELQHAIEQNDDLLVLIPNALTPIGVSSTVVEVNGDSSGHSSPNAEPQHTYITVSMQGSWGNRIALANGMPVKTELGSDQDSEGGNGVNYHVQYVEPQELYSQQSHMETLRTYPVYGVTTVGATAEAEAEPAWGGAGEAELAAYGVVVAGEAEPASPATPPAQPRMPPATVQWLLENYETADGVSLPRSTLYAHYLRHCSSHRLDPVNAASFGKLIRSVFVGLRTRRLGTRGNSKYHYYGIRAKPSAPNGEPSLDDDEDKDGAPMESRADREPTERAGCGGGPHRQHLGAAAPPDPPALTLEDPPEDVPDLPQALEALRRHHREHGVAFLESVAALDTAGVERARRAFWRRPPRALCRRLLLRLMARKDVAAWLRAADLALHQRAVELLLPDVLRPIPAHLTQAIRNFAKSLESALAGGSGGVPGASARAQAGAAAALAAALRRYTSLNHLAQAARAVLTNHHQIQQMLADLNRVDFRVVREQAAWACACAGADTARRLEADFKATLGRGATLEQWATWLENCVKVALAPHERRADYSSRARRLLLDWSFYSSLVIRELTLRSAASFGSFHLIRLLYDEYVAYLIERRVAAHERLPPIAVMHRAQEEDEEPQEELPRLEADEDDPDWDWEDEEDEEDDELECKKLKVN